MITHLRPISRIALLLLFATPVSAFAQDSPQAGLTMASNSSIGFIFHVSDSVAIRPEIAISVAKSTVTTNVENENTQSQLAPGASVLFYTGKWDALRTYISPRYVYRRAHNESSSQDNSSESTATLHTVTGTFGAEYALHRRFAIFGEAGVSYSHGIAPSSTVDTWAQTAFVGATFYF